MKRKESKIRWILFFLLQIPMFVSAQQMEEGEGWVSPSVPRPVEESETAPAPSGPVRRVRLPDTLPAREIKPLQAAREISGPVFGQASLIEPQPVVTPTPALPTTVTTIKEQTTPLPKTVPTTEEEANILDLLHYSMRPVVLPDDQSLRIVGSGVILRSGPGPDYPEITPLTDGESVSLLDTDDEWHQIETANAQKGWVFSKYIETNTEVPLIIGAERVNLREQPDPNSKILGNLFLGAVCTGNPGSGDWTRIRTADIPSAYVSTAYVVPIPPQIPATLPLIKHSDLAAPVASLSRLSEQSPGEYEYLLAVTGNEWVKGGKIGLMFLTSSTPSPIDLLPENLPRFTKGPFFQKTLLKRQFNKALGPQLELPENTEILTVAYLRGEKQGLIWTYQFVFNDSGRQGQFALVCQEGKEAGCYLILETKQITQ